MEHLITIKNLSRGADIGAQMTALSGLYHVSKHTGHTPTIINEYADKGYTLRIIPEIFPDFFNYFKTINYNDYNWVKKDIKNVLIDLSAFDIDPEHNYDFPVLGVWYYFKDIKDDVKKLWKFDDKIVLATQPHISNLRSKFGGEIVSIHFRRGDYLQVSSLNLSLNYYYEAIKEFNPKNTVFVCFSNNNKELEWVKENFKPDPQYKIVYAWEISGLLDMCTMSMCDHNIIANSSYSWWAAFLNSSPNKKIICPKMFLNHPSLNYINGNWYPKEWKALEII